MSITWDDRLLSAPNQSKESPQISENHLSVDYHLTSLIYSLSVVLQVIN